MKDKSPIDRRIAKDPVALIHKGLEILNDKSLPLDYETRMAAVVPLLQVKHLVLGLPHGPLDKSIPHGGTTDGDADQSGGGAG